MQHSLFVRSITGSPWTYIYHQPNITDHGMDHLYNVYTGLLLDPSPRTREYVEVQAGPIWHCTLGYVYSLDSFEEKGKDWCGNAIENHS